MKGTDRARLELSTDTMGSVYIEMEEVVEITAQENFEAEEDTGQRHVGTLRRAGPGQLGIVLGDNTVTINLLSVARIRPIGRTISRRFDGSIDLGASYTRSSGSVRARSRRPSNSTGLRSRHRRDRRGRWIRDLRANGEKQQHGRTGHENRFPGRASSKDHLFSSPACSGHAGPSNQVERPVRSTGHPKEATEVVQTTALSRCTIVPRPSWRRDPTVRGRPPTPARSAWEQERRRQEKARRHRARCREF